jgi:polyisoprenoid-binding protein YceI
MSTSHGIAWLTVLAAMTVALPATAAAPAPAGLVYTVDNAHSFLEFSARLLGFNRVRGTFRDYEAHLYYDSTAVTRSAVSVRIRVASISTNEDERDADLQKPDFFDARRFPVIRFDSREIRAQAGGFVALGDLTIRDVTREVEIPFRISAPLGIDPFGNPRFSAEGRLTIDRRDFGVVGPPFWNHAIGDSIAIEFEIGARRWNYDALGWGDKSRRSIGQQVLEAAGRDGIAAALRESRELWATQHSNPEWNFGLFEYVKCAGRLGQHGRPRDGAEVLAQALELRTDSTAAADLATVRCQRAELLMSAGEDALAREELARATAADSGSTFARALRFRFHD